MKGWLIAAALVWTSGHGAGSADALLTRNPSTGTAPLTLFTTTSDTGAAIGAEARLTRDLNDRLAVEGFARWSRPSLKTTIANDFESATGTEAELPITSIVYGGSIVVRLSDAGLRPFVFAGAGGSRETLEGSDAPVSGLEIHAGGGVSYRLTQRGVLRADAAASSWAKGVAFGERRRFLAVLSVGIGYRF